MSYTTWHFSWNILVGRQRGIGLRAFDAAQHTETAVPSWTQAGQKEEALSTLFHQKNMGLHLQHVFILQ